MTITNTYNLNKTKQLIDLNGDTTNFEIQFTATTPNKEPFYAIVVDQNTLDSDNPINFKKVTDGTISGNIRNDKNIYNNYFLLLKSDDPCECFVNIDKIEIKPSSNTSNLTSTNTSNLTSNNTSSNNSFMSKINHFLEKYNKYINIFLYILIGCLVAYLLYFFLKPVIYNQQHNFSNANMILDKSSPQNFSYNTLNKKTLDKGELLNKNIIGINDVVNNSNIDERMYTNDVVNNSNIDERMYTNDDVGETTQSVNDVGETTHSTNDVGETTHSTNDVGETGKKVMPLTKTNLDLLNKINHLKI